MSVRDSKLDTKNETRMIGEKQNAAKWLLVKVPRESGAMARKEKKKERRGHAG